MQTTWHVTFLVALTSLLTAPLCAVAADATDENPNNHDTVVLGVSFSDMGDFDSDWGLRAMWGRDLWLVSGGWNNVEATVTSATGPMTVDGGLWQLDVTYLLSGRGGAGADSTSSKWYCGVGAGLRSIDADWSVAGLTSTAKDLQAAGHVAVGARWGRINADVRYEIGGELFDYDADGLQVMLGVGWPLGRVRPGMAGTALPAEPSTWTKQRLPEAYQPPMDDSPGPTTPPWRMGAPPAAGTDYWRNRWFPELTR